MTMTLVPDHRRTRGKLVLLAALFVTLLHASSAAVKMGPKRARNAIGNARRSLAGYLYDTEGKYGYASGSYAASRSSGNGGKGGKGGSSVQKVAECYESCGLNDGETPSPTSAPTRSPTGTPEKPACCQGGVSSLKMLYQGSLNGTLYLSDGLETSFNIVDSCEDRRLEESTVETRSLSGSGNSGPAKFVPCSQCFPDGTTSASPSCDLSTAGVGDFVDVYSGVEVCMGAFDSSGAMSISTKFPEGTHDLHVYFREDGSSTDIVQTTLHTSCSQEIYSPYAVRLDCEEDGYPFYMDTTVIDIESMADEHPVLVFLDGTSKNSNGALFSDCDGTYVPEEDYCCKGGASFLKVRVGGTTIPAGSLTANATLAADDCDFADSSGEEDSSSSEESSSSESNGNTIRFVSCEDECLDPWSVVECTDPTDSEPVIPGEDICFGSWDETTNRIDFGSKMKPNNLEMFFVPDDLDEFFVQSAYLHTSCSKPIYPNWALVFSDDCDSSDGNLVNLDDTADGALDSSFHLAFIDGVSKKYYEEAKELSDTSGISFFDINFADCGCNCDASASPTASPSPTSPPTEPQLPGPGPPEGGPDPNHSCEQECADWVWQYCVRKNDLGAPIDGWNCDVNEENEDGEGDGDDEGGDGEGDGEGRDRFLRASLDELRSSEDIDGLSKAEQIKFHDDMAKLYDSLLSLLASDK